MTVFSVMTGCSVSCATVFYQSVPCQPVVVKKERTIEP